MKDWRYEEAFAESAAFCAGWSAVFAAMDGKGPHKVEEALHAYEAERGGFPKVDALRARLHDLEAALERIADGNGGCSSKYGPGCDGQCQSTARAALASESRGDAGK